MPAPRIPVSLADSCKWEKELPAVLVGRLLLQVAEHNHRTIARVVVEALNLPEQRKGRAKMVPLKGADAEREVTLHQHRLINKAMAMELLCASLLTHLDSAQEVVSHCSALCRRPYHFARSGTPDLVAAYNERPSAAGFRVLGEVSAKRQVSEEHWLGQLGQAVRHARTLREQDTNTPVVYALVINGGRIGEERKLQKAYRAFVRDNGLKRDGGVRVVPMSHVDIAHALLKLERELPSERFWFGADRLAQAFDAMIGRLLNPRPTPGEGWMAQVLVNAGTGGAQLVPSGSGDSGLRP